jgi:hypothetical protein
MRPQVLHLTASPRPIRTTTESYRATKRVIISSSKFFTTRDANHDGRMTVVEWTGGDPGRMADFKKRDANHDGIVTEKEAIAYGRAHGVANQIMLEADKNHDDYLSRAEVKAYYASREGPPR